MPAGRDNMQDTQIARLMKTNMQDFKVANIRRDFPILSLRVNSKPLIYLDNAATTQKPRVVLDTLNQFYKLANANVHRGAHTLSNKATSQFEHARAAVASFINAPAINEIIWCKGTTEAINLVASSLGAITLAAQDYILLSVSEHHANIVPWQQVATRYGAKVIVIPLDADLRIDQQEYARLLTRYKPKIVALAHVSNALGIIHPIREMIQAARKTGAITLIDGAQAIAHLHVDVQQLDCDFYCFSAHKCFGPTGIGVLWGKTELLERMPVWQTGGEMIKKVSFSGTTFNSIPHKFEAGTPAIADAIAFEAAINYLSGIDREAAQCHEQLLVTKLINALQGMEKVMLYSPLHNNVGVVSFTVRDIHHQDLAMLLDQEGIAVRSGHHCAMPLMESLGIEGTLRVSVSFYNTLAEIDIFITTLEQCIELLQEGAQQPIAHTGMPATFDSPNGETLIKSLGDSTHWQQRIQLLLTLGDLLPAPSLELISITHQLQQCESGVWLQRIEKDNTIGYQAWSDARIMRGLLVLLISCKQPALQDIDAFLREVKLCEYLSPSRTNGVKAIIAAL